MKVAVYTIAKNEAKQVPSFMESCRDADLVMIADTGSTDGTPELLRQAGAVVHDIAVKPWRFDVARTTALCLLPADVEVCIKLDLDERLQPGWRRELERAWTPGVTRLRYWYTWNWKAPGVPDVVFRSDLIHARAGYRWRHPTHEILDCTPSPVFAESELAIHQYPEAKPRPNDLPLLEQAVREHRCPRTVFYLGREHSFRQDWATCQRVMEEYLALPDAVWTPERSHAMRLIGHCRKHLGDAAGATAWLMRACAEDAWLRENWIDLADACNDAKDWSGCYHACERALAIRERPRHYQSFGYAWGERADDLAAVSAWYLGLKEKSAEHMRRALAVNPGDTRLQGNANFILPERGAGGGANLQPIQPSEQKLIPFTSPHSAHPLVGRDNSSDLHSFHQIFVAREYSCLDDLTDPRLILDCGGYTGYASAYFLSRFPRCRVIAVEADLANFAMLQRNVAPFGDRIRTLRAAVWSHPAALKMSEETNAAGKEWERRVRECRDGEVAEMPATDVGALLRESGCSSISVLKVDIEGAEKVVFGPGSESWIGCVENIVIELHDPECTEVFHRAIAGQPFQVSQCGELTVCRRIRDAGA
jgi:FkbM family methyltransferase